MIGYPCTQDMLLTDGFSSVDDKISMVKNNNGAVYIPEFNFNGIGFLESGQGYQVKMNEFVMGFSFCQSVQYPTLEGCTDCEASNFNQWANLDDGSCIPKIEGCTDSIYLNYNPLADTDDSSCLNEMDCSLFYPAKESDYNGTSMYFVWLLDSILLQNLISPNPYIAAYSSNNTFYQTSHIFYETSSTLANLQFVGLLYGTDYSEWGGDVCGDGFIEGDTIKFVIIDGNFTYKLFFTTLDGIYTDNLIFDINGFEANFVTELELTCINNQLSQGSSGCLDYNACNYNSEVNYTNSSFCIYPNNPIYDCDQHCLNDVNENNICDEFEVWGCTHSLACNYDASPNTETNNYLCFYSTDLDACASCSGEQDGSGVIIDNDPDNDGVCDENEIAGCTDATACNYSETATEEDLSCEYAEQGYDCEGNITEYVVGMEAEGGIVFYVDETGERGLVAAPNDIGEFSFGCQGQLIGMTSTLIGFGQNNTENITSICIDGFTASQQALYYENEGYEDWFLPTKDELYLMYNNIGQGSNTNNIGNFDNSLYWSSSEYNEIFSWYINFTDTHIDYSSKNSEYKVRPIRAFGNWTMGCIDSLACNYNPGANMADGSCTYPELGYDCQGNVNPEIGANLYGGIVFYVDETGQHGLVAAIEDIELTYEWGCYGIELNGADGQNIGSGYQNTLDIINQVCETNDGSIHAAQATIDYDSGNYNDWYLPSKVELEEMYNTLGNGGSGLNLGGFLNSIYWSSSIVNSSYAWAVDFDNSVSSPNYKTSSHRVRPIRSF